MANRLTAILGANGQPLPARNGNGHANGHARRELHQFAGVAHRNGRQTGRGGPPEIRATYDAARTSDEMKNYWANADAHDADSANSKGVRARLVQRSRYEVANNGYADGMVQTHANYVIGTGPTLRMQTRSTGFNAIVERAWASWWKAVLGRRKLWCKAHAKVQDGESLSIIRNNPRVADPVDLDFIPIETEQCTTPMLPYGQKGYIDGIHFDDFGNPIYYDLLKFHPGGQWFNPQQFIPEQVPARYVLHWFQFRRPGQHRGVPEFRSTMNVGATARRWREATVAAAETAADLAAILKTQASPETEVDPVAPLSSVEFQKRMMTALPSGWDAVQMKSEHPNATYETFHRLLVNEQGRPKSMPQNLAMCDSSGYNFASGKLDHGTYFLTVDLEREDCHDVVLDPLFGVWFERAVLIYGWNTQTAAGGYRPLTPPHSWDWPQHPVGDIRAQADANDTNLRNGSTTLRQIFADQGLDYDDMLPQMAEDYGVSVEEMQAILLKNLLSPAGAAGPQKGPGQSGDPQAAEQLQQQLQEQGSANG